MRIKGVAVHAVTLVVALLALPLILGGFWWVESRLENMPPVVVQELTEKVIPMPEPAIQYLEDDWWYLLGNVKRHKVVHTDRLPNETVQDFSDRHAEVVDIQAAAYPPVDPP